MYLSCMRLIPDVQKHRKKTISNPLGSSSKLFASSSGVVKKLLIFD